MNNFEIIVIGGGHAGAEAALRAQDMGNKLVLLPNLKKQLARCPAIRR